MSDEMMGFGAVAEVTFADGTIGEVYPMTFGKGRLYHSRPVENGYPQVINQWCYDTVLAGVLALAVWDGVGEPVGWFRNPQTGELRPENTRQKLTRT
jgi:hypothetical protein